MCAKNAYFIADGEVLPNSAEAQCCSLDLLYTLDACVVLATELGYADGFALHQVSTIRMLYLASKSPRRAEILQQLGISFQVLPVDVDETPLPHEAALDYVQRIAKCKAQAGWRVLQQQQLSVLPLLSADTTVSLHGAILGKPVDQADAMQMLRQLSGTMHEVHTALAMMTAQGLYTALSSTRVFMKPLSEAELRSYVSSGEPMDKAGAYGIQGLASLFVQRIEGSYSGVMGLPIYETGELCRQAGIDILA